MDHMRRSFRKVRSSFQNGRSLHNTSKTASDRIVKISKNLTLHKVDNKETPPTTRVRTQTLVLMFPWFRASRSAIQRYCDLYHERGLDVLCVHCSMKHFLWPSTARKVTRELLDFLVMNKTPMSLDTFLVHSASVGSYVYTVTLMEMLSNQSRYGFLHKKIKGQVFDSIVYGGVHKMLDGVGTISNNKFLKFTAKNLGSVYFFLTQPFTVAYYDRAVKFMETSPIDSEVLMYHSLNDPLCDSDAFHELVRQWSTRQAMQIHVKCWDISTHAMHLRDNPEQYRNALDAYLLSLGYEKIDE